MEKKKITWLVHRPSCLENGHRGTAAHDRDADSIEMLWVLGVIVGASDEE